MVLDFLSWALQLSSKESMRHRIGQEPREHK
jgi:hypothetical protein